MLGGTLIRLLSEVETKWFKGVIEAPRIERVKSAYGCSDVDASLVVYKIRKQRVCYLTHKQFIEWAKDWLAGDRNIERAKVLAKRVGDNFYHSKEIQAVHCVLMAAARNDDWWLDRIDG